MCYRNQFLHLLSILLACDSLLLKSLSRSILIKQSYMNLDWDLYEV